MRIIKGFGSLQLSNISVLTGFKTRKDLLTIMDRKLICN